MAMEDVKTPLLRSLSARTRSLVFGYLTADEGTAKEGRVGLLEVPDGSRSLEGFREGEAVVDLDGLGSAESVRFLYDPSDPSAGSPNLQPNLTPPLSGSWATGTLDPSIRSGEAYFTACEPTTANAGTYHLFRAGVPKLTRSENFFQLFYSSCEDVYIHAERIADENICFRWDMARERDVEEFSGLGEKRLFTLYHNFVAPSIPIVITPEVDTPPRSRAPSIDNTNNNKINNSNNNKNQAPNMNAYYVPITRKTSQASNPVERTISSITAVEDLLTEEDGNENTLFAEGLKDFMGTGRGTPAFGSTENSESGGGSREGMELPDEVNITPLAGGTMITPGALNNRIASDARSGGRNRLTVPAVNVDRVPKKESIRISDSYNRLYPYVPYFDPKQSQQADNSQGLDEGIGTNSNLARFRPQQVGSSPLLNIPRSKGSLPFLAEPRGPGLVGLKEGERKRETLVLPGIVGSKSRGITSIVSGGSNPSSGDWNRQGTIRGYQNIPGVNVNNLLPNIKSNSERQVGANSGMKILPLKEIEGIDDIVETPEFPTNRKPAVRGSPMDMYITDDIGFPVVMDRSSRKATEKGNISGLNADEWGKTKGTTGYADMGRLPEGLKKRLRNKGSIPASPRGGLPGTPKEPQRTVNTRTPSKGIPRGANIVAKPPGIRTPSPRGSKARSMGTNTPRPRTPSPTSSGLKNTGRRSPSSPSLVATDANVKTGNSGSNGKRGVREKLEIVDYKKIIEDRKKKSTIPRFKSSKDFVKWLKENRPGDGGVGREDGRLAGATAATINADN
ncbi:hypothetical protein TWF718_009285 [Orbilia javanica]|uniref:Uncharacterized protein n=1 Tax=Orbilia javanica TaxID=47235 RepID=A0AAN8MRH0_9PEZI